MKLSYKPMDGDGKEHGIWYFTEPFHGMRFAKNARNFSVDAVRTGRASSVKHFMNSSVGKSNYTIEYSSFYILSIVATRNINVRTEVFMSYCCYFL